MKSNDIVLIHAKYEEKTTHTDDLDLQKQVSRSLRKRFDFKSKEDEAELKEWCQTHYREPICKGFKHKNIPSYYDCCFCISRIGYMRKCSHPELHTASLLKIPEFLAMKSAEDFEGWLLHRMKTHARRGRKVVFPEVNLPHDKYFDDQHSSDDECKEELLNQCLQGKQRNTDQIIQQLTENNRQLLASSNNWYKKYQDLLSAKESPNKRLAYATPQKLTKTNFDSAFSF